jgi:hypothetical protein
VFHDLLAKNTSGATEQQNENQLPAKLLLLQHIVIEGVSTVCLRELGHFLHMFHGKNPVSDLNIQEKVSDSDTKVCVKSYHPLNFRYIYILLNIIKKYITQLICYYVLKVYVYESAYNLYDVPSLSSLSQGPSQHGQLAGVTRSTPQERKDLALMNCGKNQENL